MPLTHFFNLNLPCYHHHQDCGVPPQGAPSQPRMLIFGHDGVHPTVY